MKGRTEVRWLLRCFIAIGIPFYDYGAKRNNSTLSKVKFTMKVILELFFSSFGMYIVLNCIVRFEGRGLFLRLTTTAVATTLMLFRLSVALKRSQMLHLLNVLKSFKYSKRKRLYRFKKLDIWIAYVFNIGFPLLLSVTFLSFLIQNFEDVKYSLKPDLMRYCNENSICTIVAIPLYSSAYTLYFFVTPTLCVTMFIFIFMTYENTLKQKLVEAHYRLMVDMSYQTIERSLSLISEAIKVHKLIEDVLSPSIFLMYVLVFLNFLNLITINVSNFANTMLNVRTVGCIIIFLWTSGGFFRLTLKGSILIDVCNLWNYLQQDIVKNCIQKRAYESSLVLQLLLFHRTAKLNLVFSGWGMFQLDRSLLLTMVGVIVSYGVLISTI
ncbi:uncharacterized protein NPIL_691271 [Nephila pilipes]|uniref:Uncharacterized protein n=1 Tax=Nephila pilipes TaxID=299642 RepID=A0A8X6N993_NEPPI|nr:uncharacterized protein NPIL_377841 [Nephila pilipes]GFT50042.1 uncharacterized protein NPIL_691271 [Nephila pilipes]